MTEKEARALAPPLRIVHGNARTRILLHVVSEGRTTVRSAMRAAGLKSAGTALHHLRVLRDEGLVDWEDEHQATIHATCKPVPTGDDAA